MKTENWNGYKIRFVEKNGEWWAILKDICKALDLKTFKVSQRLDPSTMMKVRIESSDIPLKYITSKARKTQDMIIVNENGIYEAIYSSRRPEAREFRKWSSDIISKFRKRVGLEGYEVMRMMEPDIQQQINYILDSIFYDEETGRLMQSITVAGGDVEQVPFDL